MTPCERHKQLLAIVLGFGATITGARCWQYMSNTFNKAPESWPLEKTLSIQDPLNEYPSTPVPSFEHLPNLPEDSKINYERLYETLRRHEGVQTKSYEDSRGIRTIGAGFNLEKEGARERIQALGLDYRLVFEGKQSLTDEHITRLMADDTAIALQDARGYVGSKDWNELNPRAQEIIINMAYNLGKTRLSGFVKLREALINEDYVRAAHEMEDSRWYHQTGNRSKELVTDMRALSKR